MIQKVFVKAEKYYNFYEMGKNECKILMNKSGMKLYKNEANNWKNELNTEAGNIAVRLNTNNCLYKLQKCITFITIRDH